MAKKRIVKKVGTRPPSDGEQAKARPTKKKAAKSGVARKKKAAKRLSNTCSIYSRDSRGIPNLPSAFCDKIRELEKELAMDIWLFVHLESPTVRVIHPGIHYQFVLHKDKLPKGRPFGLLIDSPGGVGETAYRISSLLRRECGEFTAIVPRCAKSAGTLLALGAKQIILGPDAELGPLDAQFADYDVQEDQVSALDTVQAIEQLEDNASELAIKMLVKLKKKTRKRYGLLMQEAINFSAKITSPLFEKIDAIQFSRQSRMLKEAQVYAERLLQPQFNQAEAAAIAEDLVTKFPTHEFVIDLEEAKRVGVVIDSETLEAKEPVGLHTIPPPSKAAAEIIDWLYANLDRITAFGSIIPREP